MTNTMETNLLRPVVLGSEFEAPQGKVAINASCSHADLWSCIGRANRAGQFDIVARSKAAVAADPYPDRLRPQRAFPLIDHEARKPCSHEQSRSARQARLSQPGRIEIVVAVSPESGADQLVRDLQRARAKVRRLWPMPDKRAERCRCAGRLNSVDRLTVGCPGCPANRSAVARGDRAEPCARPARLCETTPDAVISRPAQIETIAGVVALARSQFDYEQRLREPDRAPGRESAHDP